MKASAAVRLDEVEQIAKDLRRLGDVADSLCIAEDLRRSANAADAGAEPQGFRCPSCDSTGAVATPERHGTQTFYCLDCEHGWDERRPAPGSSQARRVGQPHLPNHD